MSVPLYNLTDTWTDSGTTYNAIKMNVTDTASASDSKIMDLQLSGSTRFYVTKGGVAQSSGSVNWGGGAGGADNTCAYTPQLALTQGTTAFAADAVLRRDAASIIAQVNSTTAQTFRVYNTYTDASNYECGVLDWRTTSNVLTIGVQEAGTGTDRAVRLVGEEIQIMPTTAGNLQFRPGALSASVVTDIKFNSGEIAAICSSGNPFDGFIVHNKAYSFASGNSANPDAMLSRAAAKVIAFGDGSAAVGSPAGWFQWAGQGRVSSDVSRTSNTAMTDATGLSVNVQAGRTYAFEAALNFTCAAAGGIRAAISGTATATNIIYDGWIIDSAANGIKGNAQGTALDAIVANAATTGTAGHVIIRGTITVNAAGTLKVQFAQSVSNGTATVVKRGSWFIVHDVA
jgi:hypothetical protein